MKRKGICYDVGRVMMGMDWRPNFDVKIVQHELEIIKNDLHCNVVRICGLDLDRLATAAELALQQGLEVWFSPEMWDKSQEDTLEYLVNAAVAAEKLCQQWPEQLIFSVGSELTLFMQGIVAGNNFLQQLKNPSVFGAGKNKNYNQTPKPFLSRCNTAGQQCFQLEIV